MIQDNELYTQTLMKLGLTFLQAKTYLTLAKLGKAGVKRISKASDVSRPDVYRVMPALQEIGFVEKIVVNPAMYQAIPLKEGILILLQRKAEENAELQEKTKALLSNFQEDNREPTLESEESQFIITVEKKLFLRRFKDAINASQMSMDFVVTTEIFKKMTFGSFQQIKSAAEKGIRIRAITDQVENREVMLKTIQELNKNHSFKLRSTQVPITLFIIDNKEVNIHIADRPGVSLWSNNPVEVKLATICFESLWKDAHEISTFRIPAYE
jgi:sugar-specific transcriptional regulator TrmB